MAWGPDQQLLASVFHVCDMRVQPQMGQVQYIKSKASWIVDSFLKQTS